MLGLLGSWDDHLYIHLADSSNSPLRMDLVEDQSDGSISGIAQDACNCPQTMYNPSGVVVVFYFVYITQGMRESQYLQLISTPTAIIIHNLIDCFRNCSSSKVQALFTAYWNTHYNDWQAATQIRT